MKFTAVGAFAECGIGADRCTLLAKGGFFVEKNLLAHGGFGRSTVHS
ncbi:MAG: hypothetical protein ACI906_001575 [Candidatus Latescibacterota bacterium]|jgi:hypothetical protein